LLPWFSCGRERAAALAAAGSVAALVHQRRRGFGGGRVYRRRTQRGFGVGVGRGVLLGRFVSVRCRVGRLGVDGGLLHHRRFCSFCRERSAPFLLGRGEGGGLLRLFVAYRLLLPLLSLWRPRRSSS
jgi:hypothetical protein